MVGSTGRFAKQGRRVALAVLTLALCACQTVDRPIFTREDLTAASPPIRYESASVSDRDRFLEDVRAAAEAPRDGAFDVLALSSGGANGAYGAGVLTGWSARGDRPVFEVVTGVSIGALIAPFAFVGRQRDADLEAAFTDGRSDRLLQPRWALALVSPGIYHSAPLRALVEKAVDQTLLSEVAEAHRAGRRLYIGTTSLDTREQVIWDLGAVAASGAPDARDRFIDVLTASASVTGAFPPVLINLENHGRQLSELHTDGRLTANFFVAPESVLQSARPLRRTTSLPGRVWIIVNGTPEETFTVARYGNISIAGRALEAMMNTTTRANVIATAQYARLNDMEVALTTSDPEGRDRPLDFGRARMVALYQLGRQRILDGAAWTSAAPLALTSD